MYPLVETLHVLALLPFVGTVLFVDLRLLGWVLREVPVSEITARILPWTIGGFVIVVITGALLFYAIPVRTYQSIFFRIKVIMIVANGVNAVFFHRYVNRGPVTWDSEPRPPLSARIAGGVSLLAWASVIVMGRMIAYNWFDCDRQPQSNFINWAADCVLMVP